MTARSRKARLVSIAAVTIGLASILALSSAQTACSSSTCSDSETQACTNSFTTCTAAAAIAADMSACQKCVDDYCACLSECGDTCDRDKLGSCN